MRYEGWPTRDMGTFLLDFFTHEDGEPPLHYMNYEDVIIWTENDQDIVTDNSDEESITEEPITDTHTMHHLSAADRRTSLSHVEAITETPDISRHIQIPDATIHILAERINDLVATIWPQAGSRPITEGIRRIMADIDQRLTVPDTTLDETQSTVRAANHGADVSASVPQRTIDVSAIRRTLAEDTNHRTAATWPLGPLVPCPPWWAGSVAWPVPPHTDPAGAGASMPRTAIDVSASGHTLAVQELKVALCTPRLINALVTRSFTFPILQLASLDVPVCLTKLTLINRLVMKNIKLILN